MTVTNGEQLLEFLEEELGDSLHGVSYYDEDSYELLYESDFIEYFFEEIAEKSIEGIHEDLRLTTMRNSLDSASYGTDIRCIVFTTDVSVGYQLIFDDKEGMYIAVSPGTDVQFPSFVYKCLDKLER